MDIMINYTLIIVVCLAIGCAIKGFKTGMMKEILSFITVIVAVGCIVIAVYAAGQYMDHNYMFFVAAVIIILLIMVFLNVGKLLVWPLKILSKLPLVKWIDKLAGIVIGVAKSLLYTWTAFIVIPIVDQPFISNIVNENVANSQLLTWIHSNNYMITWFQQFLG